MNCNRRVEEYYQYCRARLVEKASRMLYSIIVGLAPGFESDYHRVDANMVRAFPTSGGTNGEIPHSNIRL